MPVVNGSWFYAIVTSFFGAAIVFALTPTAWWGFVLPMALVGPLIMVDVFRWGRGVYDTFDPAALVALLASYHFLAAPLIHASIGYWGVALPPVPWVESLAVLAWLNLAGLVLYRAAFLLMSRHHNPRGRGQEIAAGTATGAAVGLAIAVGVQAWTIVSLGGVGGYLAAISARREGALEGFGLLFAVGESAPFFLAILYASKRSRQRVSWGELLVFFVVMAAMSLAFGGLRGSRNTFLWPLLIAAVLVHLHVRPIPRRAVALGMVVAVLFAYFYAFYKTWGPDTLDALGAQQSLGQLEEESGRTTQMLLVDDLARIGIQTWLVGRLRDPTVQFEPARGETYVAALLLPVPDRLLGEPPRRKAEVGTEIRFGAGAHESGRSSSRIYGIAGEMALNFSWWSIPLAYLLLGLLVPILQALARTTHPVVSPLAVIGAMYLFLNDSDNVVFFVLKFGAFPAAIIWLAMRYQNGLAGPDSSAPGSRSRPRTAAGPAEARGGQVAAPTVETD